MSRELWPKVHGSLHVGVLATGAAEFYYWEYNHALRIDGRAVWVTGSKPTVQSALAAGRVRPRDGVLFSVVTHSVIDRNKGAFLP